MENFYTLNVAGLTRQLPICDINEKLSIAAFVMFSDVELTVAVATEILKRCPEHDIIMTAECKGIPLAYEMARQSGKNYIVARKSIKLYMKNPAFFRVKSITTAGNQTLYLDQSEVDNIKGKRVLIVDDVVSTGESLFALQQLIGTSGGNIAGNATVLAEGEAADRDDIIFLEKLPLFYK